ncbi:MAG: hypothetical protein AABY22_16255 [Nanoarchaeota archaeon]
MATEIKPVRQLDFLDVPEKAGRVVVGPMIKPRRRTNGIPYNKREQFYRIANSRNITPVDDREDRYAEAVELLCNSLGVRSMNTDDGILPLIVCPPEQVWGRFDAEYRRSQEIAESNGERYSIAKQLYASIVRRGFHVQDYPDLVCDAAEKAGLKYLDLPSGRFDLLDRKGIQGKKRDEIISHGLTLLRKFHYPTEPRPI